MGFLKAIIASLTALPMFFMGAQAPTPPSLGSAVPSVQALFETSLQASITSNATSATLVSGTDFAGNNIFGYYCFTVDAGTAQNEFMCGNASGTAFTNITRGVNPALGITSNVALEYAHRRGADVKQTDAPYLSIYSNIFNGTQGIPSSMYYDAHPTSTASTTIEDKNYIDNVAISGAPAMNNGQAGIGVQASTTQISAGTNASGTYPYVLTQSNASTSASPYSAVETNGSGTIGASFVLNQNYSLGSTTVQSLTSASTILNGTTTVNGVANPFDKFGGTGASSTLSITGGTTTVNLNNASLAEWNFSSISITSGSLRFSNPNTYGSIIVLKSQGNCTFTASTTLIDASGMGASTSTTSTNPFVAGISTSGGTSSNGNSNGGSGGGGGGASVVNNGTAGGSGGGQSGGVAGTSSIYWPYNIQRAEFSKVYVQVGASGDQGGAANSGGLAGGNGGNGGGGLYIECGGALTGASSTISVAGVAGANGATGGTYGSGGGGGGGGGTVVIVANSIASNFGTINVSGGASSTGGTGSSAGGVGGQGGNGTSTIILNTNF